MDHIEHQHVENKYYLKCPRCRTNRAAPELLESCKALMRKIEKEIPDGIGRGSLVWDVAKSVIDEIERVELWK